MTYPNSALQIIAIVPLIVAAIHFFVGIAETVFGFLERKIYCRRLLLSAAVLAAAGGIVLSEKNRLMASAASQEFLFKIADAVRGQPEELLLAALLQNSDTLPTYNELDTLRQAKWSRLEREKEEGKVAAMQALRSRSAELLSKERGPAKQWSDGHP
jgi:hypothetical protein